MLGLGALLWLWGALLWWCALWIRRAAGAFTVEHAVLWGTAGAFVGAMVQGVFQNNFTDAEVQVSMMIWMGMALAAGLRIRQARAGHTGGPG